MFDILSALGLGSAAGSSAGSAGADAAQASCQRQPAAESDPYASATPLGQLLRNR